MEMTTSFVAPPPFSFLRKEYQKNPIDFLKFLFKTFPISECIEKIWEMECAYMADEQMDSADEGAKKDALFLCHLMKALLEASYVMANNPIENWTKNPVSVSRA